MTDKVSSIEIHALEYDLQVDKEHTLQLEKTLSSQVNQ